MSVRIGLTEGLCPRCSALSLPDSGEVLVLSNFATVRETLQAARVGCPFCYMLVKALRLSWTHRQEFMSAPICFSHLNDTLTVKTAFETVGIDAIRKAQRAELRLQRWCPSPHEKLSRSTDLIATEPVIRHLWDRPGGDVKDCVDRVTAAAIGRRCLQHCEEHHRCSLPGSVLPSRVIDVGARGEEILRLVIPNPDTTERYAALSYCWGNSNTFTLHSSNSQELQEGFALDSLPRTLRDAVRLTQDLGLRYLWVDALCIMQGSDAAARQDWSLQVTRMAEVYNSATITISAASAPNANAGLYMRNSCLLPRAEGGYWSVTWDQNRQVGEFKYEPSSRRAWTVQENLLSPRLLIFASSGVMWQCDAALLGNEISVRKHIMTYPFEWRLNAPGADMTGKWETVVENFAARDLTKPCDKLPAIAALARRHQLATNDVYIAGLWESQLIRSLLWVQNTGCSTMARNLAPTGRTTEYRAPTWSWASMDVQVCYPYRDFMRDASGPSYSALAKVSGSVDLVDANDPFGRVRGGVLTFRGPVLKGKFNWKGGRPSEIEDPSGKTFRGYLWLDEGAVAFREQHGPDALIWCQVLCRLETERRPVVSIITTSCPFLPTKRMRVGIFYTTDINIRWLTDETVVLI